MFLRFHGKSTFKAYWEETGYDELYFDLAMKQWNFVAYDLFWNQN